MRAHLVLLVSAGANLAQVDSGPSTCGQRWSVHGVALGTSMQSVDGQLSHRGARRRESDTPATRQIWTLRGDGPAERIVVDAAVDEESVGVVLQVIVKPPEPVAQLQEQFESRWGTPDVSRHIVAGDRPGSMTEASVWIDEACDVKATLLVIKERTPRGFDVKRLGVRLERPVDPLAHLSALRDAVRDPPDR